jgi:hypothetical protein
MVKKKKTVPEMLRQLLIQISMKVKKTFAYQTFAEFLEKAYLR